MMVTMIAIMEKLPKIYERIVHNVFFGAAATLIHKR